MTTVLHLWLPIVVSAVVVFVVSALIRMATPWHRGEYPRLPNEDAFMDAVRPLGIPPGDYMVPRAASAAAARSPAFADKLRRGPVMLLTVSPNGSASMVRSLTGWFAYALAVGAFTAYLAGHVLPFAASATVVFEFVAVAAFVGYSLALWQMSIWYRRDLLTTLRATVDGLVHALVTAGVFAWLWPH
ncbi:MAG: hypothetical protein ACOY3Y_04545 [Acidobacteriota bacterium]